MERKSQHIVSWRMSCAPMMDWTDRHCRVLHRQLSSCTLLYTEMVTAPALVRGGALHLLDHSPAEHPVALQLGGSDPE
ncbi:MAG: tRNA-dihydrouridine synthase, partial [Alphaproteobacteria bacterium]|nr:tRNA-dihydrouridine synthase [Alphaproteobacteria bacterium]